MFCSNKQRSFEPFRCLDLVSFRMLAVILVSDCFQHAAPSERDSHDCFQHAAPSERDSHVLYCGFGLVLKLASRWAKMEKGDNWVFLKPSEPCRLYQGEI